MQCMETLNANMKVSEQCRIAASQGIQILGMIRRNITYKEKGLIVPLYKAIVRPHLAGLKIRGSNGSKCYNVLTFATGMLKW